MDPLYTSPFHTIDGLDITLWVSAGLLLWFLFRHRQDPEEEWIEEAPATKENLPEGFLEGDGGPL